jgi:hypothetical protein
MLSTAAVGLMLASGWAHAQAPSERKDEPKRTEEPKGGAMQRGQGAAQERTHGAQERTPNERAQGAGREEKGGDRHQATEEKNAPSSAAERNRSKASEQSQKEPSTERNRAAESARENEKQNEKQGAKEATKQGRESGKSSAETRQEKSGEQKSTAESERSKELSKDRSRTGATGQQNERSGAAANQNENNQNQPPRNAAEKQTPGQQGIRPSTATDTSRTPPNNNAENAPSRAGAPTNQANRTNNTEINQQSRVSTEKQVRISETFSRERERLAPPERNLNISIRVGESVPSRVRLHRLPAEIVSIEPEYRDYDYFSTDDDIVIVEPGTHRIVSQVPRDPSRARAQLSDGGSVAAGGGSMAAGGGTAGGSNVNCKIMRRDASGNVTEVQPSTVGSSARSDALSVTVQLPGGGSSAPIALGATAGDIVVATQGQGDCTVTLEPQSTR